ncbi:MAG: BatD family protein [Methylococcales bacterium]
MCTHIEATTRVIRLLSFGLFFFMLVFVLCEVARAEITVLADRDSVRINESFTLTFTAHASPDSDPDFSGLEQDFEILNQSQSSNTTIINSDVITSHTWTLTLMAKKTGRLGMAPIPFGQDQSPALTIEVLDAASSVPSDDSEIMLEVSANPVEPYVQAQVIYTIQFLRRVEVTQAGLNEPVLDQAIIQKLGDDRDFTLLRNGFQYVVTERKYAIFPQTSGQLVIAPLELQANVLTSRGFGFFDQARTRTQRLKSRSLTLEVKPIPAEFKGKYWLPADQISLEEQWSTNPPAIRVGEPLTRTLKLTAIGTTLSLLPDFGKLRFQEQEGDAFKQYPDQPLSEEKKSFSGMIASREQKLALIPSTAGTFHTRGIEIVWWNTQSDRLEIAELPGTVLEALPAASNATANPAEPLPKADAGKALSPQAPNLAYSEAENPESGGSKWFQVSVFLALGWAGTLLILAWRRFSRNYENKAEESLEEPSERRVIKNLKTACQSTAPHRAKDALLAWGALRWPASAPNLAALARLCDAPLDQAIRDLSAMLYRRESGVWNGAAFWEAFSKCVERKPKQKTKNRGVDLEPLFKT